ncbi:MAG: von Willebrand factor type A domain-containing protein [Mycobacteriales bacterium]
MPRLIALAAVVLVATAGCTASHHSGTPTRSSAPAFRPGGRVGVPPAGAPKAPLDRKGSSLAEEGPMRPPTAIDPEVSAAEQPVSTFGLDVDTASYYYARRTVEDGGVPSPDTVRPEEFLAAFRQDYPQPAGSGIAMSADGASLPVADQPGGGPDRPGGRTDWRLMRIGLRTRDQDGPRPDAALTFVIDVSGSMGEPGRLDLVQNALDTLIDQLRPTDSVAIVTFSTQATVVRPMTQVRERAALHQAVDGLRIEENTNLGAGLELGYQVARSGYREAATNRVILLSDGLANTGDTAADPILAKVRAQAGTGITLLGVGVGSEYGDALMERLADSGNGYAVYVSEPEQARRLFVQQLPTTLQVRAAEAKAQVTFDPEQVSGYRLIGFDDRALAAQDFRNDRVDGGEVGPGHTVTALYLVHLNPHASGTVARARARWLDPETREPREAGATVTTADLAVPLGAASARLRVDWVVARYAEQLRGSQEYPLSTLALEADGLAAATEDRDVADLATMIRSTRP